MKRKIIYLIIALCLLSIGAIAKIIEIYPADARMTTIIIGGGGAAEAPGGDPACSGYLVCQNFEGAGYDNSESPAETGAGVNEDYTTDALRGSQSLLITANAVTDDGLKWTISSQSGTIGAFLRVKIPTGETHGDDYRFFVLYNDTTVLAYFKITSSRTISGYHGTTYISPTGSPTLSENTTYYIWVDYTPSSGSDDGTLGYYVSETTTKPGSANKATTEGTNTTSADGFGIYSVHDSSPGDYIFDQVYVDDAVIGNVSS